MDFTIEAFIWLMVIGVTCGIFAGTITSFVRFGFSQWKLIVIFGMIIWIVKSWV
jgi:type IV secretory pathway TrbD component